MKIHIFALAAHGKGISGSDRIFIEFARRWQKKNKIFLYVNDEGKKMCNRQGLRGGENLKFIVWGAEKYKKFGFIFWYFGTIFISIVNSFKLNLNLERNFILYSASEFWMDSLSAFILKLRYPKAIWMSAWYQTAPNPISGFFNGRYRLSAFLYWLVQLPIRPLISNSSNYVLVNNDIEKKQFPKLNRLGKAIVVLGAVDVEKVEKWKRSNPKYKKVYDAVFQGRFHPQKGVVELIEIWRKVVDKLPNAKLAMIGDGPLMEDVKIKIRELKLENNIKLLGYVFDGDMKYETFSKSKIAVHPAHYDSGGMASFEAMAFSTPVIGFDLKAYKSYYPKGMLKVRVGDLEAFSRKIIKLLIDSKLREKIGKDARLMIYQSFSWEQRAYEVLMKIS